MMMMMISIKQSWLQLLVCPPLLVDILALIQSQVHTLQT